MDETLDRWKWIVRAVMVAEHAVMERGEKINKDADHEAEAERWVTLVAEEIISKGKDGASDFGHEKDFGSKA